MYLKTLPEQPIYLPMRFHFNNSLHYLIVFVNQMIFHIFPKSKRSTLYFIPIGLRHLPHIGEALKERDLNLSVSPIVGELKGDNKKQISLYNKYCINFFFKSVIILFFSQVGAVGTQFLSIPPSARDLVYFNSPWRNPAVLNQLNKVPELGLAYGNWLAGVQSFGFRWKGQIKKGSGGIDIRYVGLDDIELRPNKPTSKPLAYYAAYGSSIRGVYSWRKGSLGFGVGVKRVDIQIYQEKSSGTALDIGLKWGVSENIHINFSALNLGKMETIVSESPQLPRRVISSLSYEKNHYVLFGAVESNIFVEKPIMYGGGNGRYKNLIFGITAMTSKGVKSISGGTGIQFGIYSVTYGFQWGDQHLGMPQMMDITIRLP